MAVYMTGDIHGVPSRFIQLRHFCEDTAGVEWIICLGDVGLNYFGVTNVRDQHIKDVAAKVPAKLFCIHGNHERRPTETDGYKEIEITEGAIQGPMLWDSRYPNQYYAMMVRFIRLKRVRVG